MQATQAHAVGGEATAWNDGVRMWMVRQRRLPGALDQRHTDLCAEMLRIGTNGAQGLRNDLEQQAHAGKGRPRSYWLESVMELN